MLLFIFFFYMFIDKHIYYKVDINNFKLYFESCKNKQWNLNQKNSTRRIKRLNSSVKEHMVQRISSTVNFLVVKR